MIWVNIHDQYFKQEKLPAYDIITSHQFYKSKIKWWTDRKHLQAR